MQNSITWKFNSIQFNSIYFCIAQNHKSQIRLRGLYRLYSNTTSPDLRPSHRIRKNSIKNPFDGEEKEETSGRASEEGSLFQDGQTCNRCCVYRIDHKRLNRTMSVNSRNCENTVFSIIEQCQRTPMDLSYVSKGDVVATI